jgi:hypothetical protein
MKALIIFLALASHAMASDIDKRPVPFALGGSQAVFADFTSAEYKITYDITSKKASVEATINYETVETGRLVFDLHNEPTKITVDGVFTTSQVTATPNKETSLRVLAASFPAGRHQLKISAPLTQLVEFTSTGVKSAFWMSDLTDRGYIERYIPTNLIYDRFPMTFIVKYIGGSDEQKIYANGNVQQIGEKEFKISYRAELNTTCQYFHTTPASSVVETLFSYKSVDGRDLPAVIYLQKSGLNQANALANLKRKTITILDELERDYGPFLHPSVTIYVAGSGGMEYSGATMTSESALGHELYHSYFARGVMPADGNSGWIDEALASWRDEGYQRLGSLGGTSQMANHGTYYRATDRQAYSFGERFMAFLDGKVGNKGGLKQFLRKLVEQRSFDPLTVTDFNQAMNRFYDMKFENYFSQYVYGNSVDKMMMLPAKTKEIHHQPSIAELKELL